MATLGLTMIVRNEARCIERCLASARHLVDFLTVCDTGSTDETVAIATRLGANVCHRPWTGHFADARNYSLACSPADWNLILDADEWLDTAVDAATLRSFISELPRVGLICIRSEFQLHGRVEHGVTWTPRLLPRGVSYRGRIHEQPVHNLDEVKAPLLVHHDGYQPERALAKRSRNFELLKQELAIHPSNPYLHFKMGVLHESEEVWVEARTSYLKSLDCNAMEAPFAHDMAVRLLHVLARCAQYDDAVRWAQSVEQRWPESSDVFFAIGNLCLDLATVVPPADAGGWLQSAEASWLRCLEIGEHGEGDSHVMGRGSYLAAHNLAVIYEGLGKSAQAEHFRKISALRPTQQPMKLRGA